MKKELRPDEKKDDGSVAIVEAAVPSVPRSGRVATSRFFDIHGAVDSEKNNCNVAAQQQDCNLATKVVALLWSVVGVSACVFDLPFK